MKKISIIFILMMSIFANAQKQRATITLNNGTVKQGLAKIKELFFEIKFRTKKGAKKEFFDFEEIKSITIDEEGEMITYEVKYKIKKPEKNAKIENSRIPYLFQVIVKGKVSLYAIQYNNESTMNRGFNTMMIGDHNIVTGNNGTIPLYYLSKGSDDYVTYFANSGKKFQKKGIEYFSDCPDLVQKIKDKVF